MNQSLLTRAQKHLSKHPHSHWRDQFFCVDENVLDQLLTVANISPDDRILEIGSGLGFLTEKLAAKAKSVLTIEIDPVFKSTLAHLPEHVEVVYGDAYKLINDPHFRLSHKAPTKVVSNIPYSQAQNMLHNYTNYPWYQGDLFWIAPRSLAEKVNNEPILGAYFHAEVCQDVPGSAFFPQPHTNSAIIHFHRIPEPKTMDDFAIYLRRWLYNHEDMKVRNALREGIVTAGKELAQQVVTKKQANDMIDRLNLPEVELEKVTNNIRPEYYFELPEKINITA